MLNLKRWIIEIGVVTILFAGVVYAAHEQYFPNGIKAGTMIVNSGSITDSSGAISFGNENLTTTGTLAGVTLNTGQGAYELYAMNQDVESTDAVTFATLDTGQGANELYDMDQNVLTTSDVTFNQVTTATVKAPAASLVLKPTTDGTAAVQVADKDNNVILNVDTTNDRVGIGITTPGNKLAVSSTSSDTTPALGANGGKFAVLDSGVVGLLMGNLNTGNVFQQVQYINGTATAKDLLLQPNGGNVGIGTTTPGGKLEVQNAVSASVGDTNYWLKLTGGCGSTNLVQQFGIGYASTNSPVTFGARTVSQAGYTTASFFVATRSTTGDTDVPTERFTVDPSGNAGIGTVAPNAATKLDVVGAIRSSTGVLFGTDTAAANLLDDYEEGTWTPVVRGSGTAGTYELTTALGYYTKIGQIVLVQASILFAGSVTGGGTGYLQITGFGFSALTLVTPGSASTSGVDFTGSFLTSSFTGGASSTIYLVETVDDNVPIDLPIASVSANDRIFITIVAQVS